MNPKRDANKDRSVNRDMETDQRFHQLRLAFGSELQERVPEINRLLLSLERANGDESVRTETLDALFREAHSLKGAARAVELPEIERLAHALETALGEVRNGGDLPSGSWFDAAYQAADAFLPLYDASLSHQEPAIDVAWLAGNLTGNGAELSAPPPATPDKGGPSASPASALPPSAATGRATTESVRVAVDKLDALLAQAGELAVAHIRFEQEVRALREVRQDMAVWRREWRTYRSLRSTLQREPGGNGSGAQPLSREIVALLRVLDEAEERTRRFLQRVEEIDAQLRQDTGELGLVAREIEHGVMAVRLLPASTIFAPFERMVRDLAREQGKEIRLVIEGGDIEIDRKILEGLRDPLMHMLRNAVDHGIEGPDERQAQHKARAGTIRLAAVQRGSMIEIELEDDGRGLDPDRLRRSALQRGLLSDEQAMALDDREARELIFQPGFSTSAAVTETSGRGVGMDVVRAHTEQLRGSIGIDSTPGRGTRLTISVPLTLATTRAVLIEQGGQTYAIPSLTMERSARTREQDLVRIEGRQAVLLEGIPVPIVELADVLEQPAGGGTERDGDAWRPFFVLRQGETRLALLTDQLEGEQEIVIKQLSWPLRRVRNVSGAAVLGSGKTAIILNPSDMLKSGLRITETGRKAIAVAAGQPQSRPRKRHILVVDDSLTTRTLERSILEAAGYDTTSVANGVEALGVLRSHAIDLVVSDVDMPRLDGFGLTSEMRRDERLRAIPVVLVTSLDAPEHRERGVVAGADAYIVKSGFDQRQLLDTIGRLL